MSDQLAVQQPPQTQLVRASTTLSQFLGVEPGMMIETIKRQCFRNWPGEISDAQLAAFVSVANSLKVNPLLPGMLYAYPDRNGAFTPIIGPDGVFKMLYEHPDVENWAVKHETIDGDKACTATIRTKSKGEISKTVFLKEWRVANNPNWGTREKHMLEIRAIKQGARQIIHGIPADEEEYKMSDMVNVTPVEASSNPATATTAEEPKRAVVPGKSRKGAAAQAAAATEEPKNVTPPPAAAPTPEPPPAPISVEVAPDAPPSSIAPTSAAIDVETAPAAAPAALDPAPAPVEQPKPTEPAPAPAAPAKPKAYQPKYPQPEGWPKIIEVTIEEVVPNRQMTVAKRDGSGTVLMAATLVRLGGRDAARENFTTRVAIDPENAALNATLGKPSEAVLQITVERWPSQSQPDKEVLVVTEGQDVEII